MFENNLVRVIDGQWQSIPTQVGNLSERRSNIPRDKLVRVINGQWQTVPTRADNSIDIDRLVELYGGHKKLAIMKTPDGRNLPLTSSSFIPENAEIEFLGNHRRG